MIFVSLALALFVGKAQAVTVVEECMLKTGCYATVTVDSGSAKYCQSGNLFNCECQFQTCGGSPDSYYVSGNASCSSGWSKKGSTVLGKACCHSTLPCPPPPEAAAAELNGSVEPVGSGDVAGVFAPQFADVFWGVYGTTNRSPNIGRATSIVARLDVCMGGNDTDAAIATNNATTCGNQYCGSGSVNEYCNANTQAVCRDRCECAINGVTHSSCDQL